MKKAAFWRKIIVLRPKAYRLTFPSRHRPLHSNHTEYMVRLASDTAGDLEVGIIRMTAGTVLATTHIITLAFLKGCSINLCKIAESTIRF
jgi:hypothetical protein